MSRPALGAEPDAPELAVVERASVHFSEAVEAYRKGQYRRAIQELERARELDPDGKDLIYNLGLVHERLGELERALEYYRELLARESDAMERARVTALIERVEGAHAAAGAQAPAMEGPVSSEPEPSPRVGRLDGWVLGTGGLALVALTVGSVFGLRAWAMHPGSSPRTGPSQSSAEAHADARRAHQLAVVADVSFGIALLSGAAAAGLYFGREAPAPAARGSSGLGVGAFPYGISYRGRF
ncbi:MAG: tetratricopeptide repeat protein [Polyangiaceae bacterium]|nr:tetratricopeptide repeat protein [Polyangiaceae bacterium]MCW5791099.1 tetratricopeptide repeat protein [Polyangiaceae bacterium]